MSQSAIACLIVSVVFVLGTGCDTTSTQPDVIDIPIPPTTHAADFVADIASPNPLFPLVPGTLGRITGRTEAGEETILVEVTNQKKEILGVTATVVRDRVWRDGTLLEDTFDWYAQDKNGNVWYFGEDAKTYENGRLVSTAGSWEAGIDGARAGIIMWAAPVVGSVYYQEYDEGTAQDVGTVLALNQTVTVPFGRFEGCVETEDTTPLEPDVREHKYYCPGIGHTLTVDLEANNTRFELMEVANSGSILPAQADRQPRR